MSNIGPCLHLTMKKKMREYGLGLTRVQEYLQDQGTEMLNLHAFADCKECGKQFKVSFNLPDPTPIFENIH